MAQIEDALAQLDSALAEGEQDAFPEIAQLTSTIDQLIGALAQLQQHVAGLAQTVDAVVAEYSAPIELIRDQTQRLMAVKRGQRVVPVMRNDQQSGRGH